MEGGVVGAGLKGGGGRGGRRSERTGGRVS